MKIFCTFLLFSIALPSFSQSNNKYFGDAQIGAGIQVNGSGIYNVSAGLNAVLSNNLFLRGGADLAFGGSFKKADNVVSYKNYSLRLGYYANISEKFAIAPYIGLGYIRFLKTTLNYDRGIDSLNNVISVTESSIDRRYESEYMSTFSVPFGVDFYLTGKNVGFVFGYYALMSEYSNMGLKFGLVFGKLK